MKQIPIYKLKKEFEGFKGRATPDKTEIFNYALIDDEDELLVSKYRWVLHKQFGYAMCYDKYFTKKIILMHRLIMNAQKGQIIDHADHNPLNNQKSNLRFCTRIDNQRNMSIIKKIKSSQYKGVCWNKQMNKWYANITLNYKTKSLGNFNSEIEAAKAYNKKAEELFGPFALLNNFTINENI